MRVFSSSSLKVVLEQMVATRSFSSDDGAEMIFWVASFQETPSLQKLCSASLRKPMSTRTFTNSGKPPYLKVPLQLHMSEPYLATEFSTAKVKRTERWSEPQECCNVPCKVWNHDSDIQQRQILEEVVSALRPHRLACEFGRERGGIPT